MCQQESNPIFNRMIQRLLDYSASQGQSRQEDHDKVATVLSAFAHRRRLNFLCEGTSVVLDPYVLGLRADGSVALYGCVIDQILESVWQLYLLAEIEQVEVGDGPIDLSADFPDNTDWADIFYAAI